MYDIRIGQLPSERKRLLWQSQRYVVRFQTNTYGLQKIPESNILEPKEALLFESIGTNRNAHDYHNQRRFPAMDSDDHAIWLISHIRDSALLVEVSPDYIWINIGFLFMVQYQYQFGQFIWNSLNRCSSLCRPPLVLRLPKCPALCHFRALWSL